MRLQDEADDPDKAVAEREQAAANSGQNEGGAVDLEDIPQGPSGRPDDPHTDSESGMNRNA